jgi:hypothetical protein
VRTVEQDDPCADISGVECCWKMRIARRTLGVIVLESNDILAMLVRRKLFREAVANGRLFSLRASPFLRSSAVSPYRLL